MSRPLHKHWRAAAGALVLAGVLAGALSIPVPAIPDDARAAVRREVRDRLPGWRVERIDPSWEGAYTVVTTCAGHELGFQFVQGHGLAPGNAWIHPNDAYARDRLSVVSDSRRALVWFGERLRPRHLSCHEELARLGESPSVPRLFD